MLTAYLDWHYEIRYTINAVWRQDNGCGGAVGGDDDGITGDGFEAIDHVGDIKCAGGHGACGGD